MIDCSMAKIWEDLTKFYNSFDWIEYDEQQKVKRKVKKPLPRAAKQKARYQPNKDQGDSLEGGCCIIS